MVRENGQKMFFSFTRTGSNQEIVAVIYEKSCMAQLFLGITCMTSDPSMTNQV